MRLLFVLASIGTAVLSLDATVVLLTPAVLATALRVGVRPKPHLYACGRLDNSASLLLPISNLSSLRAFAVRGLSFTRFAALMALPWLAVIATEYAIFRRVFAVDLGHPGAGTAIGTPFPPAAVRVRRLGRHPRGVRAGQTDRCASAWIAAAGALALAVPAFAGRPGAEAYRLLRAHPWRCRSGASGGSPSLNSFRAV
ncbi:hypothetical protein [Micromonospora sp. DT47]|uniref:hypothetical protein n=1 Tax=Micromonospora sp. DT47 TaxID=3393431 RepID=UPI003CF434E0